MKGFWLTGSIVFAVLILVVVFENIQATCSSVYFLFYGVGADVSPTFTFFGMALLGVILGGFLFGLINSLFAKPSEDDEEDSSSKTM